MLSISGRGNRVSLCMTAAAVAACILAAMPDSPARAGSAVIGGVKMSCRPAKVVVGKSVPGPGYSVEGLLLFGSRFLRAYPPIVQRLVFLHECAHQYVGADEGAADCWAVKMGRKQGWLTPDGIRQACRVLWKTPADGAHLAGPERCDMLKQCYGSDSAAGFAGLPSVFGN
jgi:hypothetical protein